MLWIVAATSVLVLAASLPVLARSYEFRYRPRRCSPKRLDAHHDWRRRP